MFPNSLEDLSPLHTRTPRFLSQAFMLRGISHSFHCGVYHTHAQHSLPSAVSFSSSRGILARVSSPEPTHASTYLRQAPKYVLLPLLQRAWAHRGT